MTAQHHRITLDDADLAIVPVERAETIPSSWYTSPDFHAVDRDAVFARSWQGVGHTSMVANPGDYFLATVADNPIIVLRDREGTLRAFYNVCRHRGGPLAIEPTGCLKALTCKYHGWTYLLDGTLRGVPQFDRTELFDKRDYGLVPIAVDTWEGFLFVCLEPERVPPLATVMAGIADRIAPTSLATHRLVHRVDYDVPANWKVYVDNYLEGYHIPHVHPELNKALDYLSYVTEVGPWHTLQHSPLVGDNIYTSEAGAEAFYYWVYPNLMLNILPHRVQVNLVLPDGPDRCRVIFWYYYDAPDAPGRAAQIERDVAYSDLVQREDREICERVQQGLRSRAYERGRFSVQMESGVYHFQQLLKSAYAAWRDTSGDLNR
ncbi:MAG: aromatic ring-hydroxylating dioxygenase subunit alpha [Gemmatimonadetes bacterium]|nr:aromatic ring-hydroxylating dioxygenase subunit alpha [Gemmatimonadota bacterium]